MPLNALVYENSCSGHRGYYAQVLAQGLVELGVNVTLAMPQNEIDSPEGQSTVGKVLDSVTVLPTQNINSNSNWKTAAGNFDQIASVAKQTKCDHLYVPSADGVSQVWGSRIRPGRLLPSQCTCECLMLTTRAAYPVLGTAKKLLAKFNRRLVQRSGWDRVHHLDPIAYRHLADTSQRFAKRIRLLPEAIEPLQVSSKHEARKTLKLGDFQGKLITCPGAVNQRKGCDLLIRAFVDADLGNDVKLVLLGKQGDVVRRMLESEFAKSVKSGHIISANRFATPLEFDSLFAASDLVAVPYPVHTGSSSILIRAARAGKNILASETGWIGWVTKNYALGEFCNVRNHSVLTNRLVKALKEKPSELTNQRKRFLEYHDLENHLAHWLDLIIRENGIKADRGIIDFPFPDEI